MPSSGQDHLQFDDQDVARAHRGVERGVSQQAAGLVDEGTSGVARHMLKPIPSTKWRSR